MAAALAEWGLRLSQRTTRSEQQMKAARGKSQRKGILIGVWDEADVAPELWSKYLGDETWAHDDIGGGAVRNPNVSRETN